jgi:hypothetical protein
MQFAAGRASGTGSEGAKVQMMLDVRAFSLQIFKAMGCCCSIRIQAA